MAIQIRFDNTHNAITPTFVLGTRSGNKLGAIPACKINMSDTFNSKFELQFEVHKFLNGEKYALWDKLVDFAVVWCKEWDVWFEIEVATKDSDGVVKQISCTSIGEAELSQVYLYDIEINTEDDIARDDYAPTHLYDASNHEASLLHRIMDKVPHYSIEYVESRLAPIQRTFSFDNKSLYDALQEISEEIDCLFVINSGTDSNGKIERSISVYDLESYCTTCHKRGSFDHVCTECGSTSILPCYGIDTAILISVDNLADEITYSTDVGSVKNCFRLECGDELMTATVRNCNPNGSQYIWYLSDSMKADMSDELVSKLDDYDNDCGYYENEYVPELSSDLVSTYNTLVQKYDPTHSSYSSVSNIAGYPSLMNLYYNTIQFEMYLRDEMMPTIETAEKTAQTELAILTNGLSRAYVKKIETCSLTVATSAVMSVAKSKIDSSFNVTTSNATYNASTYLWSGTLTVTSAIDETQTATSPSAITVTITDEYDTYVKRRLDELLKNQKSKTTVGIENLFDLSLSASDFADDMKEYCLSSLKTYHDSCQACINLLIEQGVADENSLGSEIYNEIYTPYYERLLAIESEIQTRESEIATISALRTDVESQRSMIQSALNFHDYLGDELWLEFVAYRREDTYKNDNYISDGLTDTEVIRHAQEFLETARNEIFKSATQQHSLMASLKNLLVMKEFEPITDNFSVGNWIRVKTDDKVYKLRLLSYSINFNRLEDLSVEFSDVKLCSNGTVEVASILGKAASMSSSYGGVMRQAKQGNKGKKKLDNWVNDGLALTNMKIVNDADNQNISIDEHGMLCREYVPETDSYDDKQLKVLNKGLYLTDDNWRTAKAGIGNFEYLDPSDGEQKEGYGVIADKLIGNLILSEEVGVYNSDASVTIDHRGIIVTTSSKADDEDNDNQAVFLIRKEVTEADGNDTAVAYNPILSVDTSGNLVLDGSVRISTAADTETLEEISDPSRFDQRIKGAVDAASEQIEQKIISAKESITAYTDRVLNEYKSEVGQYMDFGENGLTIGVRVNGQESAFKTKIDNQQMAFLDEGNVVAFISNKQLYIPNAVVQKSLWLGKYAFVPKEDGGVSLVWQG